MPKEKNPLKETDDVRVNLIVPMEMRKRWKTAAVAENRSMSEMIIAIVSQYLDKKDEQMNK